MKIVKYNLFPLNNSITMPSYVGNFFARLFIGSLVRTALNFVLFGLGIFFAAKILNMKGNSIAKALSVSLIILIVSFMPGIFFFVDSFFSLLLMITVMVAAIKTIYRCDWLTALLNLIIATVIATVASIALNPVFAYAIFD